MGRDEEVAWEKSKASREKANTSVSYFAQTQRLANVLPSPITFPLFTDGSVNSHTAPAAYVVSGVGTKGRV